MANRTEQTINEAQNFSALKQKAEWDKKLKKAVFVNPLMPFTGVPSADTMDTGPQPVPQAQPVPSVDKGGLLSFAEEVTLTSAAKIENDSSVPESAVTGKLDANGRLYSRLSTALESGQGRDVEAYAEYFNVVARLSGIPVFDAPRSNPQPSGETPPSQPEQSDDPARLRRERDARRQDNLSRLQIGSRYGGRRMRRSARNH